MFTNVWHQRRIILVTAITTISSTLVGYDAGVYGSVLVMPSFLAKFDLEDNPLRAANLGGNMITVYYIGALVSSVFITPCLIWFGRRSPMLGSSLGLVVGGVLQTISPTIAIIYVGRVISGLGVGAASVAGPMYLAECATKEHRTASVSFVQAAVTFGAFISYWIGFGVRQEVPSDFQWRFLLGFQVILAGLFFLGLFFLPESPRYLAAVHVKEEAKRRRQGLPALPLFPSSSHNPNDPNFNGKADSDSKSAAPDSLPAGIDTLDSQLSYSKVAHTLADRIFLGRTGPATALSTLAYLRCLPMLSEVVRDECAEIYAAVGEAEAEREADGGLWNLLFRKKGSILRLFIVGWVGIWQANTGQLVLLTYAPTVLESLGLSSTTISLVASGGFTTWELVCVLFAVFYGLKKMGRVTAMTFGGIAVGIVFFMLAAIEGSYPVDPLASSPSKASYAMVFLIYVFVPFFCIFLGPVFRLYGSEVCTGSLREVGQSVLMVMTWAACVGGVKTTPIGLIAIGWKFWFVPAVCNFCFGVGAWFLMPETKGRTIEQMDIVFGAIDEATRITHIQQVLREEKAAVVQSA
ncbi:hypothetical protein FRB97_001745 [Tulasnella sp. 331]|nr:hypothetical protein FRB97_001745 [Tulasnella sp. 331]